MATAVVHYTAAAVSDRGRKRTSNEDAFAISVEHGVFLVCDGMGGAAAGEIASSLAVDEVLRMLTSRAEAVPLVKAAQEAVLTANEAILSRSQHDQNLNGMGTTLVGLLAGTPDESPRVWIFNVGDSRCYRYRSGHMAQITHDHSLVEEQIRMGRMTRAEAARSPFRNVITRVLGTQQSVTPDVIEAEVEPGDLFLLCSDGLTHELADEEIESVLNSAQSELASRNGAGQAALESICARLIQAANKAGGNDNITCLLVRVD